MEFQTTAEPKIIGRKPDRSVSKSKIPPRVPIFFALNCDLASICEVRRNLKRTEEIKKN